MGWKYDVQLWVSLNGKYRYVPFYQGNSWIKMILAVRKTRKVKSAVQVTIRG